MVHFVANKDGVFAQFAWGHHDDVTRKQGNCNDRCSFHYLRRKTELPVPRLTGYDTSGNHLSRSAVKLMMIISVLLSLVLYHSHRMDLGVDWTNIFNCKKQEKSMRDVNVSRIIGNIYRIYILLIFVLRMSITRQTITFNEFRFLLPSETRNSFEYRFSLFVYSRKREFVSFLLLHRARNSKNKGMTSCSC